LGWCYSYGPQQGPDRQQKREERGLKQRRKQKEAAQGDPEPNPIQPASLAALFLSNLFSHVLVCYPPYGKDMHFSCVFQEGRLYIVPEGCFCIELESV